MEPGERAIVAGFCSPAQTSSTRWLREFACQYERSLQGFVESPALGPPSSAFGRAQRLAPEVKQVPRVTLRPSRPGEEQIRSNFASQAVLRWFKQLRRLQSLCHALRAGRDAPEAQEYRWQLWISIRTLAAPAFLPAAVPSLSVAVLLFEDFRENFRRFESWTASQRQQLLQAKCEQSRMALMRELREPAPDQVDTLLYRALTKCLLSTPKPLRFMLSQNWTFVAILSGCLRVVQLRSFLSIRLSARSSALISWLRTRSLSKSNFCLAPMMSGGVSQSVGSAFGALCRPCFL